VKEEAPDASEDAIWVYSDAIRRVPMTHAHVLGTRPSYIRYHRVGLALEPFVLDGLKISGVYTGNAWDGRGRGCDVLGASPRNPKPSDPCTLNPEL